MVKLMVVDDEKDVCSFVENFFSVRGFQVFSAGSGEEACRIAEKEDPLIVLQDIRMPGIDGIETLRRMKKLRPNNQIIMVTCVDDIEKMETAKSLGAITYITKPLVLDDLVKSVAEAASRLRPNL